MSLKYKVVAQVNHQTKKRELAALVSSIDLAKVLEGYFKSLHLDVDVTKKEDFKDVKQRSQNKVS